MKYFAYGSNMNQDRMKEREVEFTKRERATLKGWKLAFNKISSRNHNEGYANIVEDDKEYVEGILYEISEESIRELDKYEGYPNHYIKISVNVILENNEIVNAVTYVANPNQVKHGLKPSKEYLNHLIKGCDLLSQEYYEKLRKWDTLD